MANDVNITIKIIPIEQSHLEIELKFYESILRLLYDNSEMTIDGGILNVELNVPVVVYYVQNKITDLRKELKKYNTKAPVSRPAETENIKAPITKPASSKSI